MKNFTGKIYSFFEREKNKVFSLFFIIIKVILSILVAATLPVIFFFIFLLKEPREIEVINNYVDTKIKESGFLREYSYNIAKIEVTRDFRFAYHIYDFELKFEDNFLFFPEIVLHFRIGELLRKKFIIDRLKIKNLVSYIGYNNLLNISEDNQKKLISVTEFKKILYEIVKYLHRRNRFIRSIGLKNSSLYLLNKNDGYSNKIDFLDSTFKLFENENLSVEIKSNLKTRINDRKDPVLLDYNCSILDDNSIKCSLKMDNFSIDALNFTNILTENKDIEESIKSVKGLFDFEAEFDFSDYINFKKSNFKLTSNKGSFDIKQLFGGNINYKNLSLIGETFGVEHIILHNAKINLLMKKIIDFSMYFDLQRKKNMKIDIDILNGSIADIKILWPVFLNDLGIRDWVIEHFKGGEFGSVFAYMNFDFDDGKFKLDSIKSEVNFEDTLLDYDKRFPAVSNLSAKAIFTAKDMNAYIKSANIANTKFTEGEIYIDFNAKRSFLDIEAKANGDAYEMMYFINNNDRKKVKNLMTYYMDGYAFSKINIKVPLSNTSFEDTHIEVESEVKNNNTFLFMNDSIVKINLLKNIGSNSFKLLADCKNSLIDFSSIDFVKKKGDDLKLVLNIDVYENRVLLNNIKSENDFITFDGSGIIEDGFLKELNFNDIKYKDSVFSVLYTDKRDAPADVFINVDFARFNRKLAKSDLSLFLEKSKDSNNIFDSDIYYRLFIKNIILNDKYEFKNINVEAFFKDRKIDYLKANSLKSEEDNFFINMVTNKEDEYKYDVSIGCMNFGKFLSESLVTDSLIYGNLYFSGFLKENGDINGNFKVTDGFNYVLGGIKDARFFNYMLNSDLVPKKLKNDLKNENTIGFSKLQAEINLSNDKLDVNNFLLNSNDVFGVGVSGRGKMNLNSGNINFEGLIIPLEKLNTLFGMNKIPLFNKLLFGGEGGGLLTIGYQFKKENYNTNYDFKLIPSSVINPITMKNLFLIFLLI